MTKIGGIIKIFSLVVAAFMVITSFGPVIETYIAKEALSLEDFEDPSITQEKKEELEKAGSELIRELKNYTRDFESFLNNALDKTSSQKDIEEAINDFKKDVIDKYLTEEDVKEEISGEILDNNSLSGEILDNNSSIQLFFEELRNHHDLYISEIEIAVNESYQKELSLKLASLEKIEEKTNKTVRVKEDKEENKDYQINEIKKSEEKTTSVAYSSATKKFLSSINKLIPTNSRLKELISKMFNISEDILLNPLDNRKEQSNNQKEFIDVNEEKKVMRYDDKIDSTLFNESSTSTLPNDFYDVDYSGNYADFPTAESTGVGSTVGMSSSASSGSSKDKQTTGGQKGMSGSAGGTGDMIPGRNSKLLWIETPEGDVAVKSTGLDNSNNGGVGDTGIDYSLADVWYVYHEGEKIALPLSLCSAFDLNVISVEKIETVEGSEFFDVEPHYGGLDIVDLAVLGVLGFDLVIINFMVKIGGGLLIKVIANKLLKFGLKVALKSLGSSLGASFVALILEMRSDLISKICSVLRPIVGYIIENAINWIKTTLIPAIGELLRKGFTAILLIFEWIYNLISSNWDKIKQFMMTVGEKFYNCAYYLAINILGGSEYIITKGRTMVGSKTSLFDLMEMSPLSAHIKEDCGSGYAIIHVSTLSADRTRDVKRIGIIINDGGSEDDFSVNNYELFTSSYSTTSSTQQTVSSTYSEGYTAGYNAGYAAGYSAGYNAGLSTSSSSSSSASDSSTTDSTSGSSSSDSSDSSTTDNYENSDSGNPSGNPPSGSSSSSTNKQPIPIINGPSSGKVGQTLTFTADGSYDPDGVIVQYDWWYKGIWHNDKGNSIQITYYSALPHTKTIKLRVYDDSGANNISITTCYITLL